MLGLIEAAMSQVEFGKGWKYRKIDPEQRWRLRAAALRLGSMGLSRTGLHEGLNLIASDKSCLQDCPNIHLQGVAKPFLAIKSKQVLKDNYEVAAERHASASVKLASTGRPTPLYVLFDDAYVKRGCDLMPKGIVASYSNEAGFCGGKYSLLAEEDKSFYPHATDDVDLTDAVSNRENLASQMLSFFAVPAHEGPWGITPICDLPRDARTSAIDMVTLVGSVLSPAVEDVASGTQTEGKLPLGHLVVGIGYDNHGSHQLVDDICLGVSAARLFVAQQGTIPFFSKLTFRPVELLGFPYAVPLVSRLSLQNPLPFYGSRDPLHIKKMIVGQERTSARTVMLGDFFVDLTWALDAGLQSPAYYCKDGQSDELARNCMDSCLFHDVPWDGWGCFLLSFLLSVALMPWFCDKMCFQKRCITSLFAYYTLLGLTMLAEQRPAKEWFNKPTLSALTRLLAHMILRCVSWPTEFGVFCPRRHQERHAEHAFSLIRKAFAGQLMGVRDFAYSQLQHQRLHGERQMHRRSDGHETGADACKGLDPQDALKAQEMALKMAARFLCLCCPRRWPIVSSDTELTMKMELEAWLAHFVPAEHQSGAASDDEEDADADCCGCPGEDGDKDDDPQMMEQYLRAREDLERAVLQDDTDADGVQEPIGDSAEEVVILDVHAASTEVVEEGQEISAEDASPEDPTAVLCQLFLGPVRSLKTLHPGMLEYMRAAEYAELQRRRRKKVPGSTMRKTDQLQCELAKLRNTFMHDRGTNISRHSGWARTCSSRVCQMNVAAGFAADAPDGARVPEAFRPRSVAAMFHASADPASKPQVLLLGTGVLRLVAVEQRDKKFET